MPTADSGHVQRDEQRKLRVLVVDDQPSTRVAFGVLLAERRHLVIEARSVAATP